MSDEIVVYQPDEVTRIETRMDGETVWLTQKQIAALFGRSVKTISHHIKNAIEEELAGFSVFSYFEITAADGKTYRVKCYNLDAILSVGYRVKSPRGVQFRQWSNGVLKERLLRGSAAAARVEVGHRVAASEAKIAALERRVEELSDPRRSLAAIDRLQRSLGEFCRALGTVRRGIVRRREAPARTRDMKTNAAVVASVFRDHLRVLVGDDVESRVVFVRNAAASAWLRDYGIRPWDVRRMAADGLTPDFLPDVRRFPFTHSSPQIASGVMFVGANARTSTLRGVPIVTADDQGIASVVCEIDDPQRLTSVRRRIVRTAAPEVLTV